MGISKITELISLSNTEISKAIIETEKELFTLRFKKATRQNFKSHQIKNTKRRLAQLKTIVTLRLKKFKQDKTSASEKIITTS